MMQSITMYEAGMRNPRGEYSKLFESLDKSKVDDHLEIMKKCTPHNFQLVFLEKTYHCVSTVPHIIGE